VADYCDDNTAQIARAEGANVLERREGPRGRKAFALRALVDTILASPRDYDAVVVFDADSRIGPAFLRQMAWALDDGAPVLQGKHVIPERDTSAFGSLAAVDMRLNNLLRNAAKQALGLSCRLMGDAMCFASWLLREHGWPTSSLGEDREFGLYLLSRGVRVGYVPQALSYGQAAPSWRDASGQRLRWYGGDTEIRRSYALRLLRQFLHRCDWAALDQAIELLLPPLSVLALLSFLLLASQLAWRSVSLLFPLPVSTGVACAWLAFPLIGLLVDRAPAGAYRALVLSPAYLAWRLWMGLRALMLGKRVRWVRTRRREEERHTS